MERSLHSDRVFPPIHAQLLDRQVLSVVLQPMKGDLQLADASAEALQTIFMLGLAIFSSPVAYLVDRWSRKKMLGSMAIIWSVCTFITGMGESFLGIAIPRALVSVGEAGFAAAGIAMIGAAYSHEMRSRVMGIFNAFIPMGLALGSILAGHVSVVTHSWRSPFSVFAIPSVLLGILAFFLKDYQTIELKEPRNRIGFFSCAIGLFRIPTLKGFIWD